MRTDIETFLHGFIGTDSYAWQEKRCICCMLAKKDQEYPRLFFSLFFETVRTACNMHRHVSYLDLAEEPASIHSKLTMSFLGQNCLYWLKNISELDVKKRNQWFAYLQSYTGPHQVIFFASEVDTAFSNYETNMIVELTNVTEKLFFVLARFFNITISKSVKAGVHTFFVKYRHISLDAACMALQYVPLISTRNTDEIVSVLEHTVTFKASLFTLSGDFFARQQGAFFSKLATLSTEYPPQFWISFWSEQLWRAYYYVYYMQKKNYRMAKTVGFRLPFSLLQRNWKQLSLVELQKAHAFLYQADFRMKNGGSDFSLDIFYTRFLAGGFCNTT